MPVVPRFLARARETHPRGRSQEASHDLLAHLDTAPGKVAALTDAPLRYYQGVADRPLQEEHYKTWLDFGVKLEWR